MVYALLSLMSGGVIASELEQMDSEKVDEVTYAIKIRHDAQYDKAQWMEFIKNTTNIIKKATNEQSETALNDIVQGLCKAIELVGAPKNNSGIHGEINIVIADDTQDETKCGNCPCTRYKGVCPCVAEKEKAADSIRTVCTEQCQKSGCTTESCAQSGCVQSCNC